MTQQLEITEDTLAGLRELRGESKFHEDPASFYPGAPDETIRARCETRMNDLLDRLIAGIHEDPTNGYVLEEFRSSLALFDQEDSEERDRTLLYLERIMDIVGVESSDGLLNRWRYGFDP